MACLVGVVLAVVVCGFATMAGLDRAARPHLVRKSRDMESARHAFVALSDAMIAYRTSGNERPKPEVVYCAMAKHSWLQPKGDISNPYYADPAMRGCGEVKSN
jgi:hypothetical protein